MNSPRLAQSPLIGEGIDQLAKQHTTDNMCNTKQSSTLEELEFKRNRMIQELGKLEEAINFLRQNPYLETSIVSKGLRLYFS